MTSAPAVQQRCREVRSDEPGAAGDERLHAKASRIRSGSRHGRPPRSSAACTVRPVAAIVPSTFRTTSYSNSMRTGESIGPSSRTSSSSSYRAGCWYSQCASMTGSEHAVFLHLAVGPAERPQQVGTRHLEPDEVVGIVDDAHLIGFGVADTNGGHRGGHDQAGRPARRPLRPRRAAPEWRRRCPKSRRSPSGDEHGRACRDERGRRSSGRRRRPPRQARGCRPGRAARGPPVPWTRCAG